MKKIYNQLKNKKGELGETITWFIATIAIVVVILVSIFFVSILSISNELKKSNFYENSNVYSTETSLTSYVLTSDESTPKLIYETLFSSSFGAYSGAFAVEVFKNKLYKDKYSEVWVGFGSEISNDYFGYKTMTNDFVSVIKLRDQGEFQLRLQR